MASGSGSGSSPDPPTYKALLNTVMETNTFTYRQSEQIKPLRNDDTLAYLLTLEPDPQGWVYKELGNHVRLGDPLKKAAGAPRAFHYFQKAHELGNVFATVNLAGQYKEGLGCQANLVTYRGLLSSIPESKHTWYSLSACAYAFKDMSASLYLDFLQKASAAGHPEVMNVLGARYQIGDGVPQNWTLAFQLWSRGASLDHATCCYNLGVAYTEGYGCRVDLDRAFECYRKAAALGSGDGLYKVGLAYWHGYGVPLDMAQAVDWMCRSEKVPRLSATNSVDRLEPAFQKLIALTKDKSALQERNAALQALLVFKSFDFNAAIQGQIQTFLLG